MTVLVESAEAGVKTESSRNEKAKPAPADLTFHREPLDNTLAAVHLTEA